MQRRDFLLGAMAAPMNQSRLDQARALIAQKTASKEVAEAALLVRQGGRALASIQPDRVFLLASITKPLTATAVMILCDRGRVAPGRSGSEIHSGVHRRRPGFDHDSPSSHSHLRSTRHAARKYRTTPPPRAALRLRGG